MDTLYSKVFPKKLDTKFLVSMTLENIFLKKYLCELNTIRFVCNKYDSTNKPSFY
jgi:hypothetical protein